MNPRTLFAADRRVVREEFEILTSELLAAFVGLPDAELDRAIGVAQRRVCELLDLDLSSVWQWSNGGRRHLTITHFYRRLGGPPLPTPTVAEEMFPWVLGQIVAHQSVVFTSLDELPPEAAVDRKTYEHFGIQSVVSVPLSSGGGPVLGVLNFSALRAPRPWPEKVVRRIELVAQIFAGALGRMAANSALRESREQLQLAAESSGLGFWILDVASSSFWFTEMARRHLGFSGDEQVSLAAFLERVVPEDRERVRAALVRGEIRSDAVFEYRVAGSDGGPRWLASRGRARHDPEGALVSIMGVTGDVTERKRSEETLHDLSQRLIRAHEAERALLARELHDDVSQRLAVLAIDAGRAELAARRGRQAAALREIRTGLVRLSEDIHALSYQLHPSVLEEFGLAEAIEAECELFRRRFPPRLTMDLRPAPPDLGADAALCLFRVAQESLSNVARHARASSVAVSLQPDGEGGWRLEVRDDGVGFDGSAQRDRRSLGLASMRERVELVGGRLEIESAPGRGTAVRVRVPVGEVSG